MNVALPIGEIAQVYFEAGHIKKTISLLEKFVQLESSKCAQINSADFLSALQILLRCYALQLEFEKIDALKALVHVMVSNKILVRNAKLHYIYALCFLYQKNYPPVLEECNQAISLSILENEPEVYCMSALAEAIVYYQTDSLEEASLKIANLEIQEELKSFPLIRASLGILKAQILSKQAKYNEAIKFFSNTLENLETRMIFYRVQALYGLALAFKGTNDYIETKKILSFSKSLLDKDEFKKYYILHNELSQEIDKNISEPDLAISLEKRYIKEKHRGQIDFQNQLILLDLLKLFVNYPGVNFSKEEIVKDLWNEKYDPEIHNNKIYVTIKRLRDCIEPNVKKPKYIFRSKKGGYYLPQHLKVTML